MSNVKVHVIGRLGSDAEVRQTKTGKDFTSLTVAVDEFIKGEKATTWFNVVDFADSAKKRAEFLKKGSLVEIQGIETVRMYIDRNSQPQIARDIRATYIDFISTKRDKTEDAANNVDCGELKEINDKPTTQSQYSVASSSVTNSSSNTIDDLPF